LKSSARSALKEGSDSLTLVLVHPEVKLGYKSHARSAQAKESLSCEYEQSIEGLLLQVCAESKELNTWKCLRIFARSVRKGLLEDLELCEAQEEQDFQVRRREARGVCSMECLNMRYKVTRRRTSFHRGILGSPHRKHQRGRDRWSGSCGEDYRNLAQPLDLPNKQGGYGRAFGVQVPGVMSRWIIDQLPVSRPI
jgi:hypothetical protein